MSQVTLQTLLQIIDSENLPLVPTPATVAYLNRLVRPTATFIYRGSDVEIEAWYTKHRHRQLLRLSEAEINHLNFLLESDRGRITDWLINRIIERVLHAAIDAANVWYHRQAEYEALALTPWDIADGLSSFGDHRLGQLLLSSFGDLRLGRLLLYSFGDLRLDRLLPVSVTINGNTFTHQMKMDLAMGILLLSRTVGRDLGMTMYGAPLTYFITGTDDIYDASHETIDELSLRMIDGDRRYFRETHFLRGIKTAAEWLGLDHHAYWDSLRDARGAPMTF